MRDMKTIPDNIVSWLLEDDNPSVKFRTLTEIFGKSISDKEVIKPQKQINDYEPVKEIFSHMHPEGYWEWKHPKTGKIVGKETEYDSFYTTHFNLAFLAELGLKKGDKRIDKAVSRYLNLQQDDGDFFRHFSCLYGLMIRAFILFGYQDDPRVLKTIDLLNDSIRHDRGYLCDIHEGKKKGRVKSCYRGSVKALLAYTELPQLWNSNSCQTLIQYFLDREIIFQKKDPEKIITTDLPRMIFPITWKVSFIDILYSLSKMGYGNHRSMDRTWEIINASQQKDGSYLIDWYPKNSYFFLGKVKKPNKWITFYIYLSKLLTNQISIEKFP
jgi:hypothetical protein